uniref:DUF11 domain-containing protein n=1 Tax=Trichocoleus desertorum TaxID=1481672 RepID=UPI0025B2D739|nr:DUF11 domain-containing protein [Trichocoleus desertorum]
MTRTFKLFSFDKSDKRVRWAWATLGLTLAIGTTNLASHPAQAEGSRNLYPATTTGNRANLEWRNSLYANLLRRRTLLQVYANQGEVILLGSSAVGVEQGDALVYNPGRVTGPVGDRIIPGTADFQCSTQRALPGAPATQGQILSRNQELVGPDTIPGGSVTNGYIPCFYVAPTSGIYSVAFFGPEGGNSDREVIPTGAITPLQTGDSQGTSVAAWDVTIRNSLTSSTDINGRLFTDYLALLTGGNGQPIDSTLLTVTTDGYRYRTSLRGIDPFGFVVFGNRVGFLDSDGVTPLNRDLVGGSATDNQLMNPQGGITIAPPEFPLFFSNSPEAAALTTLGIPLNPIAPEVVQGSFSFQGSVAGNTSLVSTGGTFSYTTNVEHVYEMVISRDGTDFDPTNPQNRVLRGVRPAGTQTVTWNGLDNNGDPFPVGTDYPARLVVRAGEYHFPLLDVENSLSGSPTYTLLNPPNNVCPPFEGGCRAAFYDDRGYRTASGETIGTLNQVLPSGRNPPVPPNSNFTTGFDTASGQRAFGDGTINGFGNAKGLDLWTYYPSNPELTLLNIVATANSDLSLTKTVAETQVVVGQNLTFTITVANAGPAQATNVVATEQLPPGLTFVSATPSQGTYDNVSGQWTIGTIANGANATLQVVARVDTTAPITNTAQISGSDQPDPDSTPGNDNPQEDDQASVVLSADLSLTKTVTPARVSVGQNATFTITVANAGPLDATNVVATEQLPSGLTFVSATPSQGTYDNVSGQWTVGTIANGATATLQVVARVDTTAPITNTAQISGSDQPDPNSIPGNNNPQENDQSSAALGAPNLRFIKRITSLTRAGAPIRFTDFVDDPNDPNDSVSGWSQLSPVGVLTIDPNNPLNSGDEVEYTLYFLSDGAVPAEGASVCDQIPPGTIFIPDSFGATTGIQFNRANAARALTNSVDTDEGNFFTPLAPLPNGNACPASAQTNANGSVIVNLGEVSSTPGQNFGFVRFRVRID